MPEADAVGAAPGKLILAGEHAVVYGHRAVAAAVTLGTTVELRYRPGPSGIDAADIDDGRLWPALQSVLPEAWRAAGLGLTIRTTLPVGCGMGSSAALAVAVIRAVAALEGRRADFAECYDKGFVIERAFHGTPSGIDHTVSSMGGVLCYRRGTAQAGAQAGAQAAPQVERLPPPPLAWIVLDTGRPARTTAEMVAGVRARQPTAALDAIGALVERLVARLRAAGPVGPEQIAEIGAMLDGNHRLLQEIGVSTDRLDAACGAIRAAGAAGAKLAGAGGGGVAIGAVAPDQAAQALAAVQAAGWTGWVAGIAPEDGGTLAG